MRLKAPGARVPAHERRQARWRERSRARRHCPFVAAGQRRGPPDAAEELPEGGGAEGPSGEEGVPYFLKLWVQQSWGELFANPLFRRTISFRFSNLWKHPILRPVALGLFLAATFGLVHDTALNQAAGTGYVLAVVVAVFAVPIIIFFGSMAFQRGDCAERIRRHRDNGSLEHYLSSGMSVDATLLGLVHPYEIGERLGFLTMMLYFAFNAADRFSFWLFMFFSLMNLLSLFSTPFASGPHLEQFFSARRFAAAWRVMLMAGVPMAVWFVTIISLGIALHLFFVRSGKLSDNEATIIALVAAMFLQRKFGAWWMRRSLANFVRRQGSIPEMLDEYLEAGPR